LKKISFIIHGLHFDKHKIKNELEKTFNQEYDLSFYETTSNREAEDLAEKASLDSSDYIIAVGGDGTLSEVINGIMRVPKERRKNLIVGLLPTGSGNDFARTMHLTKSGSDLYKLVKSDQITLIDIGKLEFKTMQNKNSIRYFDNITDIGLGAEVAKRVNEGNKTYGPNLAFFSATILGFLNYKRKRVQIESSLFVWKGNVLILCLANGKYFGSGLGIAPHAKVNDGKIAVTLAADVSLIDYLLNLFRIRKCLPIDHSQIFYKHVDGCSVEPIGDPCLIEADGEMIGKIPLKVSMLHNEINFLTPRSY
jgi:diacylglycerol kinase (ATP)